MRLDNSAFTMYAKCGKMYFERYEAPNDALVRSTEVLPEVQEANALQNSVRGLSEGTPKGTTSDAGGSPLRVIGNGIELIERSRDGLDFGTYFHALADRARRTKLGQLQNQLPTSLPTRTVDEAEATFAAYEAHWLGNDFEYLESERTHALPLPGSKHELLVKIDAVVRFPDRTIGPLDTKTESKPGHNFREDWAGRTQASLYLWALQVLYPKERVSRLVVDVVTRGTARRAPSFNRLDDISRPQDALDDAIRNVIRACDEIEESRASGWWKSNMNICKDSWKRCDYYDLHVYGRTAENLAKYRPAEAYLDV